MEVSFFLKSSTKFTKSTTEAEALTQGAKKKAKSPEKGPDPDLELF